MRTNTCKAVAALAVVIALTCGAAEEAERNDDAIQARIRALEQELQSLKEAVNGQQARTNEDAKVEALDQKVRILERKQELEQEAAVEKAKKSPSISAGADGFYIRSADSNFVLRVGGYVHADARFYPDNANGTATKDTFLFRRVRPFFEGTVWEKYDYRLLLDFPSRALGSTSSGNNPLVADAYVNAHFLPEFQVEVGKFKGPVGLERNQMARNMLFIERSYPTELVPNRDLGLMVHGELFERTLDYATGVFNGAADGGSDDFETSDSEKDFEGRLFAHPFRNTSIAALQGLGFSVAGTYGDQKGTPPSFVSLGQQTFFSYLSGAGTSITNATVTASGPHWRVVPQAYYYWGPFGLYGEYAISQQQLRRDAGKPTFASIRNSAWEVSASYFLTGEANSWRPVAPKHPFSFNAPSWGAWELAARVGQLTVDQAAFPVFANPSLSARRATSWGVGLNWHLNRNIKFSVDYDQTWFTGGSASSLAVKGEKALFSRIQFSY